jgi:ActR/RegA family two-component response regulator
MSIRLYIDEDSMDRALVRALRARGVDVTTALEEEMIERGDAEHLDYATAQGRVLYSFNREDFYRLHTTYLA